MSASATTVAFAPLLPWWAIVALGVACLALVGLALWRRASGAWWRAAVLASLLLALANPALVEEEREMQRDTALVVVDDSPSQRIGDRRSRAEAALGELQSRMEGLKDLDVRVARIEGSAGSLTGRATKEGGTRIFRKIEETMADVPRQRRAGTIVITDGQVHDAPDAEQAEQRGEQEPPLHVLLTGQPDEADRRIAVVRAPSYGIVGSEIEVTIRVDDLPAPEVPGQARVSVARNGVPVQTVNVVPGRDETLRVPIEHAGSTIVELEVEPGPEELTDINNRAVVMVNGVRDRLRVLLVSGHPHSGERVWRNLLKSDPAVDLVHFTILRPPEKQDATPIRELSLIAFPIRELFEAKLFDFDLIVFDRYHRRGVIPQLYLANVTNYVRQGGALLEAVGPGFAEPYTTLYRTPLGQILPGEPTGQIFEEGFRPEVTDTGRRHPVTAEMTLQRTDAPEWGRWFRHIDAETRSGETLMSGVDDRPLLVLDRVGEGRVGQLLSDHIWLWSRGYEGGGPHGELLRRLAHWLMKEPDLEENALRAAVRGDRLFVERRSLEQSNPDVSLTAPNGESRQIALTDAGAGRYVAEVAIDEPGLYKLTDGERTALAAAGPPNPVEFTDVRTTAAHLAPLADASGGGVFWISESGVPDLRRVRPGHGSSGRGWAGLRANGDYVVTGVSKVPLLPPFAALALIGATLVLAWRREAR